jgi:hypothetical protein
MLTTADLARAVVVLAPLEVVFQSKPEHASPSSTFSGGICDVATVRASDSSWSKAPAAPPVTSRIGWTAGRLRG